MGKLVPKWIAFSNETLEDNAGSLQVKINPTSCLTKNVSGLNVNLGNGLGLDSTNALELTELKEDWDTGAVARIKVLYPLANSDIANKAYVDGLIDDLTSQDIIHEGLQTVKDVLDSLTSSTIGVLEFASTPNVSDHEIWITDSTSSVTITNLITSKTVQKVTIIFLDANTEIEHGTNIKLAGATNFTGQVNDTLSLVYYGSVWYQTSVSVNNS